MYKSNLTVFTQISQLIDKNLVNSTVRKHQSDKHSKGFPTWNHLMCMIFAQLSSAQSIRDITYGISSTSGNLHHLGIRRLPRRSTLSYANKHRSWEVFRDIYLGMLHQMQHQLPGQRIKFRIKSKIYLFDSTIIPLSLEIFDWAKFRQRKGALKLHTLLNYRGAMPEYIHMTEGKASDVTFARSFLLPPESVVVADRGYYDFDLLKQWDLQQVRFVVRVRSKMLFRVLKENPIKEKNILKDQIILTTGLKGSKYKKRLRRVVVYDEANDKEIILLTNERNYWTAKTISQLYKARWEIEFFFKDIKQHLKINSFVGTTPNAVLIQIWTAMLTLLLLKYLKMKARFNWHLSNLISFIRFTLFASIHLFHWLNQPIFVKIREGPQDQQLSLFPE